MELHSRGGGGASPQGPIPPEKKNPIKKIPKEEVDWVEAPSSLTASRARAVYFFFFNLGLRLQTHGDRGNGNREDLKEGFRIRWCSSGLVEGKEGLWLGFVGLV